MNKMLFFILLCISHVSGFSQTKKVEITNEEYLYAGIKKLISGDYLSTISIMNAAIKQDEFYENAYIIRGMANQAMKDYLNAIYDYTMVIHMNDDYKEAFLLRAGARKLNKDYTGALSDYSKAIEADDEYTEAYYRRGILELELSKKVDGCQDLTMASNLGYAKADYLIKQYCK